VNKFLVVLTLASMLAACGGGAESPVAPAAALAMLRAQALAVPGAVTPEEAARQLMDFGESMFPEYFPGHKTTQSLSPFVYRYYAETGIYLGVVVTAGTQYELNGVYVMGGAFGNAPLYVGPLARFITPVDSTLGFQPFAALGSTVGVVSDPTVRPLLPSGRPAVMQATRPVDFAGNGRPDLLTCYVSGQHGEKQPCRVLRPQADGTVTDVTRQLLGTGALPSTEWPNAMVIGDFNGDGRPDVFIAGEGTEILPFYGETNVLLISNADGTYSDRSSTLPQIPDASNTACGGDVNGDGTFDIYVGNTSDFGRNGPYFLMGNGDGTFRQDRSGLPATLVDMSEGIYESCTIVDVDKDGHPDLVLGASGAPGGDNIILFNDGTGNFTRRPRYVLPPGPFGSKESAVGIVAFDVNRDGFPDLLINYSLWPNYDAIALQMLINRGDGTFTDETSIRLRGATMLNPKSGPNPAAVRVVDFNGDGWEDFYFELGQWVDDFPRFWINNRDGTFTPVVPDPVVAPFDVAFAIGVVDFDGDGRPDLLRIAQTPTGDIMYSSHQNQTQRAVPSEPLIGSAIGGNARATISFAAPLGAGASPITGYTATCSPGTITGVVTGAAGASPITVTGLTNGKFYSCSVTAASATGSSLPSAAVTVKPRQ
jgi:hypothetical protein